MQLAEALQGASEGTQTITHLAVECDHLAYLASAAVPAGAVLSLGLHLPG
jgi:hypothetical protein